VLPRAHEARRRRVSGGRRRGDRLLRRTAFAEVDREHRQRRRRRDGRIPAMSSFLELRGISKSYGAVHPVSNVTFAIPSASIRAPCGDNAAGQAPPVKTPTGVVHPDDGEVLIDGEPVAVSDPPAAHRLGILAMYQEPTVFQDLTVAENVFAGHRPLTRAHA